jgi:hypothetical protein
MAHAALHFSIGLAAGMILQAPALRHAWKRGREQAPAVLRWLLVSWALGTWAIIPSLLRYAGLPDSFCHGWWMNLFLFHPLINDYGPHGTIIGGALLVSALSFQYALIVAAIITTRCASHKSGRFFHH